MKNSLNYLLTLTAAALTLIGCAGNNNKADQEPIPGIILENMDTLVSPTEDFYSYVNGNWMKTNTIPDDESRWGGFGVLRKSTRNDVLDILLHEVTNSLVDLSNNMV